MTDYRTDRGGCVGCPPEMGCLGVSHCPQCRTVVLICDVCGQETDELFERDYRELCWECAMKFDDESEE